MSNPYGLVIGPDGALYFCDLDNQRIRRLDLKSKRMTTIAGNGQKGYTGDGGPAIDASLTTPDLGSVRKLIEQVEVVLFYTCG